MTPLFSKLNISWFFAVLTVILIAVSLIPREASFFLLGFLIFFSIFSSLEDAVSLFVRLIPFFIALPITESFDNFNSWRIISIVIFLKWVFERYLRKNTEVELLHIWKNHKVGCLIFLLFVFAFLSLFNAVYLFAGIKRIIYFVNLILISIVVADLINPHTKQSSGVGVKSRDYFSKIIIDAVIASVLVVVIGFSQLISAYYFSFGKFMDFWVSKMQYNFYGHRWAEIVMSANTWFAYNMSEALRLRVFSIFPDSHTFPLFLLATLPFILFFWFESFARGNKKELMFWYTSFFLFFLIIILSGTRGIWAAILSPFLFLGHQIIFNKNLETRKLIYSLLVIFTLFFISFGAAYLILQKSQFQIEKTNIGEKTDILKRVSSIINTSETSNAGRIQIWRASLNFMWKNPLLGAGIGNFPTVLKENIEAAKAGASAHNLYLNVGAEMGIPAMVLFLWLFWEIFRKAVHLFYYLEDTKIRYFGLGSIISLLWIYGYNLTDAALFDERAFLIFAILAAVIVSLSGKMISPKTDSFNI